MALCLVVGITLGLLGAGGSILIVPIFVYAAGMDAREAISLSLGVVSITSFVGSIWYFKRGFINTRLVAIFVTFGSLGAFFGARLTPLLSHHLLLLIFGILMLGIGLLLVIKKEGTLDESAMKCQTRFLPAMFTSVSIGVLTGFLGVGGGFLIVPALSLMMKCSMKSAIGTSLLIISANAMAGFAGHAFNESIDWKMAAIFSGVAALGSILGVLIGEKASVGVLKKSFALLIIGTGIFVIFKNMST